MLDRPIFHIVVSKTYEHKSKNHPSENELPLWIIHWWPLTKCYATWPASLIIKKGFDGGPVFHRNPHTDSELLLALWYHRMCSLPLDQKQTSSVIIWTQIRGHAQLASNEGRGLRKEEKLLREDRMWNPHIDEETPQNTQKESKGTEHFIASIDSNFMCSKIHSFYLCLCCIQ